MKGHDVLTALLHSSESDSNTKLLFFLLTVTASASVFLIVLTFQCGFSTQFTVRSPNQYDPKGAPSCSEKLRLLFQYQYDNNSEIFAGD